MLEKEAQHFRRRIRSLLVRIGSGRTAARPGVAGAVDVPVLQNLALANCEGRAGIRVRSRNLPVMYLLSSLCPSNGMFDNIGPIVRMHGSVTVAVKDNGRDHRATCHALTTTFAPLPHGSERRRHIGSG